MQRWREFLADNGVDKVDVVLPVFVEDLITGNFMEPNVKMAVSADARKSIKVGEWRAQVVSQTRKQTAKEWASKTAQECIAKLKASRVDTVTVRAARKHIPSRCLAANALRFPRPTRCR